MGKDVGACFVGRSTMATIQEDAGMGYAAIVVVEPFVFLLLVPQQWRGPGVAR